MTMNGYLKIDDIDGESLRAEHEDEIDVHDVLWSIKNSGSSKSGSGRKRSRAKFSPLVVRKITDASSPYLALGCMQGKSYAEVILAVEKGGDAGGSGAHLDYLVITMTNVRFSKFEVLGVGDGQDSERIEEELSLVFENVEIKYTIQDDDGAAGDEHEITFDIAAGV